jgi:hypothetical protein
MHASNLMFLSMHSFHKNSSNSVNKRMLPVIWVFTMVEVYVSDGRHHTVFVQWTPKTVKSSSFSSLTDHLFPAVDTLSVYKNNTLIRDVASL